MPWRIWPGIWILYRIANRSSCFININFILNSFLGENRNPIVNTNYNPWSAWTPCPQTCQAANQSVVQVRNRTCFTSPQGCFATIETRPCGVPICPGLCECFNYGQEHNRPFPSNLVPLFQNGSSCKTFRINVSLICRNFPCRRKSRMVSDEDSFCHRGKGQLGNGLLSVNRWSSSMFVFSLVTLFCLKVSACFLSAGFNQTGKSHIEVLF